MVPAEDRPKLLKLKSSWHRRRRSKLLAVNLKYWKAKYWEGGGGGTRPRYLIVCLWRRLLATAHSDPLWARTCFGCVWGGGDPPPPMVYGHSNTSWGGGFERSAAYTVLGPIGHAACGSCAARSSGIPGSSPFPSLRRG